MEVPNAAITLVLACSEDPPENLTTAVKALCTKAGVDVDFWSVSRLADFLDHDPRGQWLRQDVLEIPAVRISWELLQDLSAKSCRSFAASIFEDGTGPRIERKLDDILREELKKAGGGVRFLVAESGFGKSFAALAFWREHVAAGGIGLWLTPEDVATGGEVEAALEVLLRRLHPKLLPGCGADALAVTAGRGGLALVVDDLSRAAAPMNLLVRLASWGSSGQDADEEGSSGGMRSWSLICPIWPRILSMVPESAREAVQARCLNAGAYTPEEGSALLRERARSRGGRLTAVEAGRLSESLGHDPLLLSLLDPLGGRVWGGGDRPAALEVLSDFLKRQCSRLEGDGNRRFVVSEYEDALFALADRMLEQREMAPTWARIRGWFGSQQSDLDVLRQIADGQVAHLAQQEGGESLQFRHGRVRDAILAAALARSMRNGALPHVVLNEPFYAELLGQALLEPGVEPVWASRLRECNPLSLFRALQLFETPRGPVQEEVVKALTSWVAEQVATGSAMKELVEEAARFLAATDSPVALELSRSFPERWPSVRAARFRNGEVAAGVDLCGEMWLGVFYSDFTPLLEHVQARYGRSMVSGLAVALQQGLDPQDQLRGALILAGYLAESDLAPAVRSSWERAVECRMALLTEFLWAALRCLPEVEEEANRLLDPICEAWRTLPSESVNAARAPAITEVIEPLQDAFFWQGLQSRAISALIRRATGSLNWPITVLLHRVDAPESFEFTVRQAAASGGYLTYGVVWDRWDVHGRRPGDASIERLERVWKAAGESAIVRVNAFHLWSVAVEGSGLQALIKLQHVERSEPFYHKALRQRIRLGDRTAVAELIQMVETQEHPDSWWHQADRIWNETLREALDSFLGRVRDDGPVDWEWEGHYFLAAALLIEIPPEDSEALFLRHWDHLRYRSSFVRAALAVATPSCCELVAETVRECPDPRRLLQYFGVGTVGRTHRFGQRQMEAILPYLEHFSDFALVTLWRHCNQQRWFDFRRRHLDAHLTAAERRNCQLGREALFEHFDSLLAEAASPWSIDFAIEQSRDRGEPWGEFLEDLLAWLRDRRTLRALDVVAHALIDAGSRADLDRLELVAIDADPIDVRRVLDQSRFLLMRRRLR